MTSMSRKLRNVQAKTKGQEPMRFLFKIKPISVTDIQRDIESVVFVWQRGAKIQETRVQDVNHSTGSVTFDEDTELCQSTTCYRTGDQWQPKDYKLKLQSVTQHRGMDKTKTIAKYEIDFSVFCQMGIMGGSEDIQVNMKPRGVLNAVVTAQWLKDFDHSMADDAVSDMFVSASHRSNRSWEMVVDDQEFDEFGNGDDMLQPTSNGTGAKRTTTAQARLQRPSTIPEAGEELDFDKEPVAPPPPANMGQRTEVQLGPSQKSQQARFGWFGSKAKGTKLDDSDLEFIGKQVNVELLRKKAKELLMQRDMEQMKASQLQHELKVLEDSLDNLSPNQKQMVKKIRVLEEQLAQSQEMDTMQLLVEAKTQLADAHYQILQLQGSLHQEQRRNREILNKFTSMQTQRDILLNKR
eukprot:TRINITY_DN886_c0_g2_i1.p1 TRINITY_DN886_c0_g2~~TRINITY_DN886_c0_g2_i1.p1  ORF type:complete len:409 (-),score=55.68 TRINITY_DN886_c0_g2_i1:1473-2699(-)